MLPSVTLRSPDTSDAGHRNAQAGRIASAHIAAGPRPRDVATLDRLMGGWPASGHLPTSYGGSGTEAPYMKTAQLDARAGATPPGGRGYMALPGFPGMRLGE